MSDVTFRMESLLLGDRGPGLADRRAPLRDGSAENQEGRGGDAHEGLQGEQTVVKRSLNEWPAARGCTPYRNDRNRQRRRGRATRSIAKRRPDEERKDQICLVERGRPGSEHEEADDDHR